MTIFDKAEISKFPVKGWIHKAYHNYTDSCNDNYNTVDPVLSR